MVRGDAEALPRSLHYGPTKGVGPSIGMTERGRTQEHSQEWLCHKRRYQGMRWIRPTRIRTAAARAIRTAQASSEKRGADLVCVGELALLMVFLLR
jgi:hypothetical protein